ncbi:hypothetical protein AAMO2058_000819000 [Amorphochlora amoebiformis]
MLSSLPPPCDIIPTKVRTPKKIRSSVFSSLNQVTGTSVTRKRAPTRALGPLKRSRLAFRRKKRVKVQHRGSKANVGTSMSKKPLSSLDPNLASPHSFLPSSKAQASVPVYNENRPLSKLWPAEFDRYEYEILPRSAFKTLSLLSYGGVGAILATNLSKSGAQLLQKEHAGQQGSERVEGEMQGRVLKAVLKINDWNEEIGGYHLSPENEHIVGVRGVTLVPAYEVNALCRRISKFAPRKNGGFVPLMIFDRWEGSLEDAMLSGEIAHWGLAATLSALADAASGIALLHSRGCVHRDVKPDNILFNLGGKNGVKGAICDLGMCCSVKYSRTDTGEIIVEKKINDGGCGTRDYMAPECKQGREYSLPADIYSLAVTVGEVARAANPTSEFLDPLLRPIVRRGRAHDPGRRPSASVFASTLREAATKLQERLESRERARPGLRSRKPTLFSRKRR